MKKCSVKEAVINTQVENFSIIPTANLDSDLRLYSKTLAPQQPFIIKYLCREIIPSVIISRFVSIFLSFLSVPLR